MAKMAPIKSYEGKVDWDEAWAKKTNSGSGYKWLITDTNNRPAPEMVEDIMGADTLTPVVVYTGACKSRVHFYASDGAMVSHSYKDYDIKDTEDNTIPPIPVPPQGVTIPIHITIPANTTLYDKLDVYFDVDCSGSMRDEQTQLAGTISDMINMFQQTAKYLRVGCIRQYASDNTKYYGFDKDYQYIKLNDSMSNGYRGNLTTNDRDPNIYVEFNPSMTSDYVSAKKQLIQTLLMNNLDDKAGCWEMPVTSANMLANNSFLWRNDSLKVIIGITDENNQRDAEIDVDYSPIESNILSKNIRYIYINTGTKYPNLETLSNVTNENMKGENTTFTLANGAVGITSAIQKMLRGMSTHLTIEITPEGNSEDLKVIKYIKPLKKDISTGKWEINTNDPSHSKSINDRQCEFYDICPYPDDENDPDAWTNIRNTIDFAVRFSRDDLTKVTGIKIYSFLIKLYAPGMALVDQIHTSVSVNWDII